MLQIQFFFLMLSPTALVLPLFSLLVLPHALPHASLSAPTKAFNAPPLTTFFPFFNYMRISFQLYAYLVKTICVSRFHYMRTSFHSASTPSPPQPHAPLSQSLPTSAPPHCSPHDIDTRSRLIRHSAQKKPSGEIVHHEDLLTRGIKYEADYT